MKDEFNKLVKMSCYRLDIGGCDRSQGEDESEELHG
jgi:hypothetical protein